MKTKPYQSDSVVVDTLEFDLFAVSRVIGEPFIAMYGICSAFGYQLADWQREIVQKGLTTRAIFEKWQKFGEELKAGTRPFPEWLKRVDRTVEVWR